MQLLLGLFGIRSRIALEHKAGFRALPDGRGGVKEYYCQDAYRLTVSNTAQYFREFDPEKAKRPEYRKPVTRTFVSATLLPEVEDVYCLGVPTTASFDLGTVHSGNCAEILLGNRSICNLTEVVVSAFDNQTDRANAVRLAARMNYRQTCINLDDGVLQRSWHELNQFLRLCGVGLTGLSGWTRLDPTSLKLLRQFATQGANSMALELGLPVSKAITTVKPSGTLSKVADCSEGVHTPLGQFLINNVSFSEHDALLPRLEAAGYRVFDHPTQSDAKLVAFPVSYPSGHFTDYDGTAVNLETAIDQLNRYKLLMDNYVDHNCSTTISYDPAEIPAMVQWLHENWSSYVGVAFLPRVDPTKTAKDLGYAYLPQEVITWGAYEQYTRSLKPVDFEAVPSESLSDLEDGCATGSCPVR